MMQNKTEQNQITSLGLIITFIGFLTAFGLCFFLLPKRTFSETENRNLKQYPKFTFHALFFENWSTEFETFVSDQFPLRDAWVGLKTASEYALGKRQTDGIYYAKGGLLIQDYQSSTQSANNAASIQKFYDAAEVPVYFGLIPDSILLNQHALPPYALNNDQYADIQAVEASLSLPAIPICDTMLQADDPSKLYYRTDHHWSDQGVYCAYRPIAEALGHTPLPESAFEQTLLSSTFYGTLQAKGNAFWVKADQIVGWLPKNSAAAKTEIYENNSCIKTLNGYFSLDRLNTRDQYSVFLDGNHSRTVIYTNNGNDQKLLLIKDSFSHSLAPLLSAHYGEIHLLDLRYYRMNIGDYIREHEIDQTLILYSMNNFSTDTNLIFLAK